MSFNITLSTLEACILDDKTTVITTITNYGYLMYTCNMLKSLKSYGLDKKVLIISIDKRAANILTEMGYHVYCINDTELSRFSSWNTKGYDKICYIKLKVIYNILSLHKNVLLVDGDIVFQKNPINDILSWNKNTSYDVWIQNDSLYNHNIENMCTGYMYIKSNENMIQRYDCVSEAGIQRYMTCAFDNNDQTYFNKYVKPFCAMWPLPLENYPNGKFFYENTEALHQSVVLVHFNWVIGHLKMAKMKEHKMWLLTPEEEEIIS
jgi:hypothetical protein